MMIERRLLLAAGIVLMGAGLYALWQVRQPRPFGAERANEPLPANATAVAAQSTADAAERWLLEQLVTNTAPSATATDTPTPEPRPPTMTPRPTWAPDVTMTPGRLYLIPEWSPTPRPTDIVPTVLPCPLVTPDPYDDQECGLPV